MNRLANIPQNWWRLIFGLAAAGSAYLLGQTEVTLEPLIVTGLQAVLVALAVLSPPKPTPSL